MMCILVIMCAAPPIIIVGSNCHRPRTHNYNYTHMIVVLRCDDIIMIMYS